VYVIFPFFKITHPLIQINIVKNDTTAYIPLRVQPLAIAPSYEYISTIPDILTTAGEYSTSCWKGRSATRYSRLAFGSRSQCLANITHCGCRDEIQNVFLEKLIDSSNQILMTIFVELTGTLHDYEV
jgi:hypothetical protein